MVPIYGPVVIFHRMKNEAYEGPNLKYPNMKIVKGSFIYFSSSRRGRLVVVRRTNTITALHNFEKGPIFLWRRSSDKSGGYDFSRCFRDYPVAKHGAGRGTPTQSDK